MKKTTNKIRREHEIQKDIDKFWSKVDDLIAVNGAITADDKHWIAYQMGKLNDEMDKAKKRSQKEKELASYNKDEDGNEVTLHQWKIAQKEAAKNERSHREHRAVVQDISEPGAPEIVYINAAAAMRAIKDYTIYNKMDGTRDPAKDGDKLYDACDSKGKIEFCGYNWYYATPEDIQKKINKEFAGVNEDDYID